METRNLLVTLSFDGRHFHGWQVQNNAVTVMGTFQDALEAVLGTRPDIKGCSRTDSGVHARDYKVSFKTESSILCERLIPALNSNLPRTIAVTACREVPLDFHARYSVVSKRYVYRFLNTPVRDPFQDGLALHIPYRLDAEFLNNEAKSFIGKHDFSAFQNTGRPVDDAVRTIFESNVVRKDNIVEFSVTGDGFLYNMVRIMAGTLLDIHNSKIPAGSIHDIIMSQKRSQAGATVPACGLTLEEVIYNEM